MYANSGYDGSWAYSNEDDDNVDHYSSPSMASDDNSAQELRDLEELLYSYIHYEPNSLHMTGTAADDDSCSDVHITELHDDVSGRCDVSGSAAEQEISITSNSTDDEVIIIDALLPQDEAESNTTASSSSFSKQLKRKAVSCKTSELADEIKTNSKKVDAKGFSRSIALESTAAACSGISPSGKKEVCRPDWQHVAKKKLKVKDQNKISHAAASVKAAEPLVVDSESESASDAFCGDLSSDDLSSNGADDIKLSNISVDLPRTSDIDALYRVLKSLPGMLFFC